MSIRFILPLAYLPDNTYAETRGIPPLSPGKSQQIFHFNSTVPGRIFRAAIPLMPMQDTASTPSSLPEHWLVYRLGHLGDVILTTGVLAHFGHTRGWRFTVLTGAAYSSLFQGHPFVNEIIGLEAANLSSPGNFLSRIGPIAAAMRGQGLLDLHGTLRSRLLAFRWQGPVARYPKYGLERRLFLASGRFGEKLRRFTVPQRYAMALASPPPPVKALEPRIWLSHEEDARGRETLERLCGPHTRPVALHPYATHSLKTWPPTHWENLAAMLDKEGVPWLTLGRGQTFFSQAVRDLTNQTNLRETCALLSHCSALVTGDSGPTTREWGFFPPESRSRILESSMACRPCSLHGSKLCPEKGRCLTDISPEQTLAAIKSLQARPAI